MSRQDKHYLEGLSVKDLIEIEEKKLQETLPRAFKSPLYRERWKARGFKPGRAQGLENLALLPFLTRGELFRATRTMGNGVACSKVGAWFTSPSSTEPYEWFPFSASDFLGIAPMLARMSRCVGLQQREIILAVTDTPPRVSHAIPYLWTSSEASRSLKLEFIIGSLDWYDTWNMTWIDFAQRRQPTVLFTSTRNAIMLVDKIEKEMHAQPRDVLAHTRVGIFFGEPLKDNKSKLTDAFPLEPYEVYSPAEHMSFNAECEAHAGVHIWMDTCIPEIIPVDLDEAVPIWKTAPGTEGELVLTNFAECLPLIRFKTGELIRHEGTDRCTCGRTHPRITRPPKNVVK